MKPSFQQIIAGGWEHSVGIMANGMVIATGGNSAGQCDTKRWNGIVQIAAGDKHTIGLKLDGTVVATGENDCGQCDVDNWNNIIQVTAGGKSTVGVKSNGAIVTAGKFSRLFDQRDIGKWINIVQVVLCGDDAVGLAANGTVIDSANYNYNKVNSWRDIVQIATGLYGTIGLKSGGTVVASAISEEALQNWYNVSGWKDIVQIAAGHTHVVGLRNGGTLVAAGNQHYQFSEQVCINNWDTGSWRDIIQIAAGRFFTLGLKSDGTVLAVGHNYFKQCKVDKWRLAVPGSINAKSSDNLRLESILDKSVSNLQKSKLWSFIGNTINSVKHQGSQRPYQQPINKTQKPSTFKVTTKQSIISNTNKYKAKGGNSMSRRLEDMVDIDPTQPHVATVMLVDTSGSMSGNLGAVNEGLKFLKEDLEADDLASKRVDLAIVTFDDSTQVVHSFSSIENFEAPTLTTGGRTCMGDAILKAAEMVEERKQMYKSKGMDYFRPWIFMITDGEPTDMSPGESKWNNVIKTIHDGEKKGKFLFFCVAVDSANTEILKQIAPPNRPPVRLRQGCFKELFGWFSKSQSSISSSNPGDQIKIETPMAAGWGDISV